MPGQGFLALQESKARKDSRRPEKHSPAPCPPCNFHAKISFYLLLWLLIWFDPSQAADGLDLHIYSDQLLANTVATWKDQLPLGIAHHRTNTLTAIQALIHDRADLIATARPLNTEERHRYQQIHGDHPVSVPVGLDAIGIYVHRDSPIHALSLPQVHALFSATRSCHRSPPQMTPNPTTLYGLTPAIGGYYPFSLLALCGAPLRPMVTPLAGDRKVIEAVTRHPGAYGYASASLASAKGPRLLLLQPDSGSRPVAPTPANLIKGRYPLTHYLYIHFRRDKPAAIIFARFSLSDRGQALLKQQGLIPLPPSMTRRMLQTLDKSAMPIQ